MSIKKMLLFLLFPGLIAGAVWLLLPAAATKNETVTASFPVELVTPRVRQFTVHGSIFGTVVAPNAVSLQTRLDGEIVSISERDESAVAAGDTLFVVGGRQVELQIVALRSQLARATERLGLAEQNAAAVHGAVEKHLSKKTEWFSAQQSVTTARAAAQDAQNHLQLMVSQIVIRSPVAGIFSRRQVAVGQFVTAGQELAAVIPTPPLRLDVTIATLPENVSDGDTAVLYLDDGTSFPVTLARRLLRRTKVGQIKLWLAGTAVDLHFHPGQRVAGTLVFASYAALSLPVTSVFRDAKNQTVVVRKQGGTYLPQPVRTGRKDKEFVEILQGLSASDSVVGRGGYEILNRVFSEQYKIAD